MRELIAGQPQEYQCCGKCKAMWPIPQVSATAHTCPPTFEEQQAAIRKFAISQATVQELLDALAAKGHTV